jgi:nucleotide-binding universal stress UspA family protein
MTSPTSRPPIVVGIDSSESAREAAAWAADLAAARRCPLHLVHVVPDSPQDAAPLPTPRWLHQLADAAVRSGANATDVEIVAGATEQLLIQRADGARLLVVGSYGAAARSGTLVGRTGLTLVERAPCPIAVVRGRAPLRPPPRSGPVVVGVDGSPASVRALVLGADLAAAVGGELLAVHAFTDVTGSGGAPRRRHEDWARLVAEAAADLDATVAAALTRCPRIRSSRRVVAGTTLGVLMDHAGSARVVVVGQRDERAPAGEMVLGSTSRGLVEFAPCPVVVLPVTAGRSGVVTGVGTST